MRCFAIAGVLLLCTATGWTQTTIPSFRFTDEFKGTLDDETPVSWEIGGLTDGTFKFDNEDLVLSGTTVSVIATKDGLPLSAKDGSAQVQLRLSNSSDNPFATIFSRSPAVEEAYFGGIAHNGLLFAGEVIPGADAAFNQRDTNLSPSAYDVVLQFDSIGNEMTVSAWDARSPKPDSPLSVSYFDRSLTQGPFGLGFDGGGDSSASVNFRSYQFVPEPSATSLAGLAVMGLLVWRRKANACLIV